jgi:hypothetical protein
MRLGGPSKWAGRGPRPISAAGKKRMIHDPEDKKPSDSADSLSLFRIIAQSGSSISPIGAALLLDEVRSSLSGFGSGG